jgi:hypothetical protein
MGEATATDFMHGKGIALFSAGSIAGQGFNDDEALTGAEDQWRQWG